MGSTEIQLSPWWSLQRVDFLETWEMEARTHFLLTFLYEHGRNMGIVPEMYAFESSSSYTVPHPEHFYSRNKMGKLFKNIYIFIYLSREGEVPLQSPLIPFVITTSRAVPSTTDEWDLRIRTTERSQAKPGEEKHGTAMRQVSSHWEPQRAISLLHTCFEKVDLYSVHQ